jgi:hypothetical protein
MKTFSKARLGTMIENSTTTRPKELCSKVIIVVRMKICPEKVTIMRMILPSDFFFKCVMQFY